MKGLAALLGRELLVAGLPVALGMRFKPSAAEGLDAVYELRLVGTRTRLALRVSGGTLEVTRRGVRVAGAWVAISLEDLIRLSLGLERWHALLGERRLTLGGDPFLAMRFPALFGLLPGQPVPSDMTEFGS